MSTNPSKGGVVQMNQKGSRWGRDWSLQGLVSQYTQWKMVIAPLRLVSGDVLNTKPLSPPPKAHWWPVPKGWLSTGHSCHSLYWNLVISILKKLSWEEFIKFLRCLLTSWMYLRANLMWIQWNPKVPDILVVYKVKNVQCSKVWGWLSAAVAKKLNLFQMKASICVGKHP